MLSVQYGLELVCGNNRLPNQLLLSSEIDPFRDQPLKNPQNLTKFLWNPYEGCTDDSKDFQRKSQILGFLQALVFKLIYLGAQEELIGQTVVSA